MPERTPNPNPQNQNPGAQTTQPQQQRGQQQRPGQADTARTAAERGNIEIERDRLDTNKSQRDPNAPRQGQTINPDRPERSPDDEGDESSSEEGLRSGDLVNARDVDPAIRRDAAASGTAPIKKGPPPTFPREQQPASRE
jgi:hypothetical protein